MSNDTEELENLFDSVSKKAKSPKVVAKNDSEELEDLGRSYLEQEEKKTRVFNRVGHMIRTIHNILGDLTISNNKVENVLEKAVYGSLSDAQEKLEYISKITEKSANRVLNATDVIKPLVEDLEENSKTLSDKWDKVFNNQYSVEELKDLAIETRKFLKNDMQKNITSTQDQLTEIMMAQDFQDLTGQVIKRMVLLTKELEQGLMSVLVDITPEEMKNEKFKVIDDKLHGPIVNPEGMADVVVNQKEVDDLLDSLGL